MKFNRFYLKHATLSLLTLSLLATTSIQAQTVQTQPGQNASTTQFGAIMYPTNSSSPTIQVNFDNLSGGSVRISIRNQDGYVCYEEYARTARYRRRFDLSPMPAGEYTVQVSKRDKQYTQTFVIDAPVFEQHIALKSVPTQPSDKNLAVKQ